MKIAYVASFKGAGGAERCFLPVAKWLAQRGHEQSLHNLCVPTKGDFLQEVPGEVVSAVSNTERPVVAARLFSRAAKADVVVALSELTPTYVALAAARGAAVPLIAEVQVALSAHIQALGQGIHRILSPHAYRRASWIRCVSRGVAKDLQEELGVDGSTIRVLENPFELGRIESQARERLPQEHEKLFRGPTVIVVARAERQKRIDLAISALAQLRRKHGVRAKLLILGIGSLESTLRALAADSGVSDQVHFLGFVPNPYPYLLRSTVFMLSSDYEGFGRAIVDALAVGCLVVSTDCPSGPAEILQGGTCGRLVATGDVEAMADALAASLSEDPENHVMRSRGLQRAADFSHEHIAKSYEELLETAVTGVVGRG